MEYFNQYPSGIGLGDVLFSIYNGDFYSSLDNLNDKLYLYIPSHNPFVYEIFKQHPNGHMIQVADISDPMFSNAILRLPSLKGTNKTGIKKTYITKKDEDVLNTIPKSKKIVVIAATGSGLNFNGDSYCRNIPISIVEQIVDNLLENNILPVIVGRTYKIYNKFNWNNDNVVHKEPQINSALSVVDKLSIPGTLELIRRSNGCVMAHSSMCLYAWWLNKDNIILYPKEILDIYKQTENPIIRKFFFGLNHGNTIHSTYQNFNTNMCNLFYRFNNVVD